MTNNQRIYPSSIVTALVMGSLVVFVLIRWMSHDPTTGFTINAPGQDDEDRMRAETREVVQIGSISEQFDVAVPQYYDSWSQFRGEDQSNTKRSSVSLADAWQEGGPVIKWTRTMGEGHAAAAIHKGRVFVLDYDETIKADMLRCLSLETGEEIWGCGYKVKIKRNHGISRTIPAVTDDYVVTIGPRCHVMCVKTKTGEFVWGLDMTEGYGTEIPFWYTGQCPLIDNGQLILAPGGSVLMIGVDLTSGDILWECKNEMGWGMSHASVIPMEFSGVKMYVYAAIGGVVGVSADPAHAGEILWSTNTWKHSVVAPSPVQISDDKVFLTAGYGAGSMVLQIRQDEESGLFTTQVLQEYGPDEGLASEQQTPVFSEGLLYSIQPKDAGGLRNQLVCVDPEDCTRVVWSSGKQRRFGLGPYLIVDDKMYVLDDDGTLTMIRASATDYQELAHFTVIPDGHDAWGPLAVADGFMVLRDSKEMVCIDLTRSISDSLKKDQEENK